MRFISFVIVILFAAGCSTSKITSSWKSENALPKKYNKILVLGLIREADRTLRERMEEHFAGDLRGLGYNAVASMSVFGPNAFTRLSEDSAVKFITGSEADAVITIVLLDKVKERHYVSARLRYGPAYNRFGPYYSTMYDRIYGTGYFVTDTKYFWESNLYDMSTGQLLYSVQTQSFSPSNTESLAHEYGRMIVNNMVEKQLLLKQ